MLSQAPDGAAAPGAGGAAGDARGGGPPLPWVRPRPGIMGVAASEFRWLQAQPEVGLVWDSTLADDAEQAKAARDLIARALSAPLLPAQQHAVLAQLEADPKLVHRVGLRPEQLPALVEHTPVLAYELLLRLVGSQSIQPYYQVLARMELSLHSMEVVNRLTSAADLPAEFVQLYVTNCINACEGIKDKYLQNRLVRLVCVFLQSLMRHRAPDIAALLHEVQAFCINFSRIREAATLFRVLKQMEAGGGGGPGSSASGSSGGGGGGGGGADGAGGPL
ncbi:Cn1 [Scenedesmus sp. PABB004]|nr:Cn1 [Scenedesmus sp. PABB004]